MERRRECLVSCLFVRPVWEWIGTCAMRSVRTGKLIKTCRKLPELADHVKEVHPRAANELSGVKNWELTEMRGRLGLGVARK